MAQLTDYGERVVDRLSMMGMWLAVVVSIRNFFVCLHQYRRTHGKIHIANMSQVGVIFIHRLLYGIIPLFEVTTCAYFPLLVSLWHIAYILFYVVMFMRLIILESDRHSRYIKIIGITLITVRFADWPYELAFHSVQEQIMQQSVLVGSSCWAQWGQGVIILNFIGDALANLFLSGMFVRRLYLHIRMSRTVMTRQNRLIEHIARKSLICLTFTFVVNLIMNLLKITMFIGDRSDAFTVYFELVESTLLVEALRVDSTRFPTESYCENCGLFVDRSSPVSEKGQQIQHDFIRISRSTMNVDKRLSDATEPTSMTTSVEQDVRFENGILQIYDTNTPRPDEEALRIELRETTSAPTFGLRDKPNTTLRRMRTPTPLNLSNVSKRNSDDPTSPLTSPTFPPSASTPVERRPRPLSHHPEWNNNEFRMF